MWSSLQFSADLLTSIEKILNEKLHLCSDIDMLQTCYILIYGLKDLQNTYLFFERQECILKFYSETNFYFETLVSKKLFNTASLYGFFVDFCSFQMYCETSQSKTLHILRHIFQSDKRYIWKKFIISLANQFASQLHTFSFAIYVLIWLSFYFRNIYKTFMSRYFWGLKELHFSRKVVFLQEWTKQAQN